MIPVDCTHLSRPGARDHQVTLGGAFENLAVGAQQGRFDSEKWSGRRSRFKIGCPGQRGNQNSTGFCLPPGIHNWTTPIADGIEIPLPYLWINRLSYRSQQLETGATGRIDRLTTLPHQCPDRSGRGVEDIHLVFIYHLPETRGIRVGRHPLEHQRYRSVGQGAIDNIAMPSDPANISSTPVDIAIVIVKHIAMGHRSVQLVSAAGM